jgi:hypothetical protein
MLWSVLFLSLNFWSVGLPVNFDGAPLKVERVAAKFSIDRRMFPEFRYEDCIQFFNGAPSAVRHVQAAFTLVDADGSIRRPVMPVDDGDIVAAWVSSGQYGACRFDAYEDGDAGLRLVGWINRVDFDDGSSWNAPTQDHLEAAIRATVSHPR